MDGRPCVFSGLCLTRILVVHLPVDIDRYEAWFFDDDIDFSVTNQAGLGLPSGMSSGLLNCLPIRSTDFDLHRLVAHLEIQIGIGPSAQMRKVVVLALDPLFTRSDESKNFRPVCSSDNPDPE